MVRKFRTEYKSKNLQWFCREQKVSYNKMLHALRSASYHKPGSVESEVSSEQGMHPFVIDPAEPQSPLMAEQQDKTSAEMMLDDIDLSFGARVSLYIGSCSKSALVSLVKEMEGALC